MESSPSDEKSYNRGKERYEKDKEKYYGYLKKEERDLIKQKGEDLSYEEYAEKRIKAVNGEIWG